MLEELKEKVCFVNRELPKYNLVTLTWGNVSERDPKTGFIAIKPSGVEYDLLKPEDIVIVDLKGNIIEGNLRPSSDTPTHLELYKAFPSIGSVLHTHSRWATTFSQASLSIPPLGTTHADTFYGPVPLTRALTEKEIENEYEKNTGKVIIETFTNLDPLALPAVLVRNHGPFTWGRDSNEALHNAIVLEEVAFMAYHTLSLNPNASPVSSTLLDKHYYRKHGKDAYYGQK